MQLLILLPMQEIAWRKLDPVDSLTASALGILDASRSAKGHSWRESSNSMSRQCLVNTACHKLIKAGSKYPTLELGCQYSATQRVQFLGASQPELTVTSACNVVIYGFLTLVLRSVNSAFSGHLFTQLCCSFKGVLKFLIIGIKKRMSWSVASVMIRPVGHT